MAFRRPLVDQADPRAPRPPLVVALYVYYFRREGRTGQTWGRKAISYFWMLWDDRKQTWHDKIMNTLVVKG